MTPVEVEHGMGNVFVVNVLHSHDYTRFEITSPDGQKTTVHPQGPSREMIPECLAPAFAQGDCNTNFIAFQMQLRHKP